MSDVAALEEAIKTGDVRVGLRAASRLMEEAEAEAIGERVRQLEAALGWLVRLKDGPRDGNYAEQKPAAWDLARSLLKPNDLSRLGPVTEER